MKILVVDGSESVRRRVDKVLKDINDNLQVYHAENGADAIDVLEKNNGINILFSEEKSLTNSPLPEYNLLDTGGLYFFKNL